MKKSCSAAFAAAAFLSAILLAVFVFAPVIFTPGSVLLAPDYPPNFEQPGFFERLAIWSIGDRGMLSFDHILRVLTPSFFHHLYGHLLCTTLAAAALYAYLRAVALPFPAALGGGLAFAFSGYLLTLANAGHRGIFILVPYAVFTLACIENALRKPRWFHFVLASFCLGEGITVQPDIAVLLFSLCALYAVWRAVVFIRREGSFKSFKKTRIRPFLSGVFLAAVVFSIEGATTVRDVFEHVLPRRLGQIEQSAATRPEKADGAAGDVSRKKKDQWIFATNWSLPPEAMLEFVAPNLRGTFSGAPESPYWGRLGESFEWEKNRQGFANFRQHSLYTGAVTCAGALFALVWTVCGVLRRKYASEEFSAGTAAERRDFSALTWFWALIALVALALAMGRYNEFCYRCFYALPGMSLIRAPVKFVHIVNLSLSILFALGIARLLAAAKEADARGQMPRTAILAGKTTIFLLIAGAILLAAHAQTRSAAGLMPLLSLRNLLTGNAELDAKLARLFLGNYQDALLHGAWMFALAATALSAAVFSKKQFSSLSFAAAMVLALAAGCDGAFHARPYIQAISAEQALKAPSAPAEDLRALIRAPDGYGYSQILLTQQLMSADPCFSPFGTFERSGFSSADPYQQTWNDEPARLTLQYGNLPKHWLFHGTLAIFANAAEANKLLKQGGAKLLFAYQWSPQNGFQKAQDTRTANVFLLTPLHGIPPVAAFYAARKIPDSATRPGAAIEAFFDPAFDPLKTLLVSSLPEENTIPETTGLSCTAGAWSKPPSRSGRLKGTAVVTAKAPAMLLLREKFMRRFYPHIAATVNGTPVPVVRANGMFLAVPVPQGESSVAIWVKLPWLKIGANFCFFVFLLVALVMYVRRSPEQP